MRAVSLFSGCGGFCEGAKLAGFHVEVAVELDSFACETYRANFPQTPLFEGDIHSFLATPDSVANFHLDEIDLLFGGPPCQGYSQIGPRSIGDPRNSLYEQFARIATVVKPKAFLLENVPNILLLRKGIYRDQIVNLFRSIGYSNTTYVKVSAADFGVPQARERVFFFGTRDGLIEHDDLQSRAYSILDELRSTQVVTVWNAIGDLPAAVVHSGEVTDYPMPPKRPTDFLREMRTDMVGTIYGPSRKGKGAHALHNHHTKEIGERRRHLIGLLKQGAKGDSLPPDVWNGKRPEKWRRLHPDLPSYTILAQMHRDLSEWVHPTLERWITVREAARLQSFHDGFIFKSSEWQQLKQIGNAVPPLLARAVSTMIAGILAEASVEQAVAAE